MVPLLENRIGCANALSVSTCYLLAEITFARLRESPTLRLKTPEKILQYVVILSLNLLWLSPRQLNSYRHSQTLHVSVNMHG
jgi:hypothetical protein